MLSKEQIENLLKEDNIPMPLNRRIVRLVYFIFADRDFLEHDKNLIMAIRNDSGTIESSISDGKVNKNAEEFIKKIQKYPRIVNHFIPDESNPIQFKLLLQLLAYVIFVDKRSEGYKEPLIKTILNDPGLIKYFISPGDLSEFLQAYDEHGKELIKKILVDVELIKHFIPDEFTLETQPNQQDFIIYALYKISTSPLGELIEEAMKNDDYKFLNILNQALQGKYPHTKNDKLKLLRLNKSIQAKINNITEENELKKVLKEIRNSISTVYPASLLHLCLEFIKNNNLILNGKEPPSEITEKLNAPLPSLNL